MILPLCVAVAALQQVEFRGGIAPVPGEVTEVSAQGATIGGTVVAWDRIRTITGDGAVAEAFAEYSLIAEQAWRARSRLQRGDTLGAEPLFEQLFERYRGSKGPMSRLVCEGLLRCRLRRGAIVGATEAWLATLDIGGGGEWAVDANLPPVIDGETGLVPALPPMWTASSAVASLTGMAKPTSEQASVLAAWYARAAAFECGLELPTLPARSGGASLVAEIVVSRTGTREEREAARKALRDRLEAGPMAAWREAWCRAALGRSLILEEDEEQRLLGIVELLHVPARFADVHPYLAGLALAEAAGALRALGDAAGAQRLEAELREHFPTHSALDAGRTAVAPGDPSR